MPHSSPAPPSPPHPHVAAEGATNVDYSFDFGGPSTPVAAGFIGVHPGTTYNATQGYGFTTAPASNGFRDRGGDDLLKRDFTIANNQAFAVDVPNGTYEVTTWAGDLIAGNGTNFDIEGTAFAGPRTSTGVVHEQYFPAITVSDGQLNVRVTGGDGRVNGLRVQTPLAAPAGLAASDIDAVNETITLDWQPVTDATGYAVFRAAPGGELAEIARITDAATTTFTDASVALGESYDYAVATVKGARVSKPGDRDRGIRRRPRRREARGADRHRDRRDRPQQRHAELDRPGRRRAVEGVPHARARTSRSSRSAPRPSRRSPTPACSPRGPYLYQLVALNAGGTSAASATYATAVATTLVRQAEYLDRAPVAVQTDDGVYVGWRLLGLDARDLAFDVYRDGEKHHRRADHGRDEPRRRRGHGGQHLPRDGAPGRPRDLGHRRVRRVERPVPRHPAEQAGRRVLPDGQTVTYWPGDGTVGDLDGDGEYELVFLWNPSISKDNSQSGYTGNVYADAVKFDGTSLWRIDLGVNIRAGAHYTQLEVFDFDGDGRSEVAFKTADGTVDGVGTVIGNAERRLPQLERATSSAGPST